MIKVVDIKQTRNNKFVVTMIKNDKEITNIFTEDTIIRYNLLSLKELSDKEYKRICEESVQDELYSKAVHFIDYQMRSISEVKKHLRKSTNDETVISDIIAKLKKQNYVNDIHFVEEYITQKIEYDLIGPKQIKEKLINKGIHYDLIDGNLIRFTDDLQYNKINVLIQKEIKYPIKKPYKKALYSIKAKLVNKGFSLRIIDSCLTSNSDLIKESCLEEDMLIKDLQPLLSKYDISKFNDKDKVIQKLLQKGYSYENVKKHLN